MIYGEKSPKCLQGSKGLGDASPVWEEELGEGEVVVPAPLHTALRDDYGEFIFNFLTHIDAGRLELCCCASLAPRSSRPRASRRSFLCNYLTIHCLKTFTAFKH